jgi:hypothetical protein|tara:strand:+ start:800 stop:1003 length:204 start_codon:yes stop_codon:yes gene_type:complete
MRREVDAELFMPDFKRRLDQSQSALEEELSARIDTAAKVSEEEASGARVGDEHDLLKVARRPRALHE